ncbi:hypothetical protein F3Y22_tig00000773pilonHSYRG00108 [Hibiscus syriacus]|uniref:Uncharacterized protein n=1 Tax=Hibiscus syriacus TaxID=106335 RepID=A0A6A3D104_HIBSY|nr:hypothetical protein F3Y22_tig00000773pilonHSYRG00108 [Hibiscus syriacus]
MEEEQVNLGSSILVPCVQEVAEGALNQIPRLYQRPDQDPIETPSTPQQVPVIDMQKLLSGDSMDVELEKLHHACKHWAEESWGEQFVGGESEERDRRIVQAADGRQEETLATSGGA